MRVLINAVSAKMGGAATHLPNFLRGIGRLRPQDAFVVCVGLQWAALEGLSANVHLLPIAALDGRPAQLRWHLSEVPALARAERADVLISLLNFGPLRAPLPHVVFERNPLYFCRLHLDTLGPVAAARTALERILLHRVMRGADRIVTPSAAMREMIRTFHPDLPPEKFRVVYHGFGAAEFLSSAVLPDEVSARLGAATGVRLLYATHAASHKGLDVLLDAARVLHARDFSFTLWLTIDRADWPAGVDRCAQYIRTHGLDGVVVMLGRIPHAAIHRVYHAADVFVFPSLCESFGFPLVEAMGSGLPIVAADTGVNRELCQDAAVYYPPLDSQALTEQVCVVAADAPLRERLRRAATSRAQVFSWERHVAEVWKVVTEVAGAR